MIVVDASVLVGALADPSASALRARLGAEAELAAPAHVDLEVTSAFRGALHRGRLDDDTIRAALDRLVELPIHRHGTTTLLPRIWSLRSNVTPYDAAYVALAEALDCPLLTADARLARATGPRCAIELVG